jgi:hypothetical protein
VAPPCGNLPYQYYNWSVSVPVPLEKGAPLEFSLHRDYHSYYRTQYRIEQNSVVVSPHDFPVPSGWYGFHESVGTLKSFEEGVIHNYTERRLLAFLGWACGKWPVDRNRVFITAISGSGVTGAVALAVRHPEAFQMVVTATPITDYKAAMKESKRSVADVEMVWGKVEWDLKTDTGKSVWDELNLAKVVREWPDGTEPPFLSLCGAGYGPALREFFLAFLEKGGPMIAYYNMWGGRMQPISLTGNWGAMIPMDIRGNVSLPAFRSAGTMAELNKKAEQYGNPINQGFRWNTTDLVDETGRYEIGLRSETADTADVTLRRLQKFKVEPGKTYAWEFAGQKGEVTVGKNGLLTVPGLRISGAGGRLSVVPK